MEINFTVYGVPVGKGRPRITRYGSYTPQKTKEYEARVQECWRTQSGKGSAGRVPMLATICAYFPVPRSVSKKKAEAMAGTFHVVRPDADNIAKAILDALNGLAFPDDSAVQIERCYKIYTNAAPRVEVTIREAQHG